MKNETWIVFLAGSLCPTQYSVTSRKAAQELAMKMTNDTRRPHRFAKVFGEVVEFKPPKFKVRSV